MSGLCPSKNQISIGIRQNMNIACISGTDREIYPSWRCQLATLGETRVLRTDIRHIVVTSGNSSPMMICFIDSLL